MSRDNAQRRQERAKRKDLFSQLLLQAEILQGANDRRASVILDRMMMTILDVVGKRGLNAARRQILADHFTDCCHSRASTNVELGGGQDRDIIYLDGAFYISDLAKRLTWSDTRTNETIENNP